MFASIRLDISVWSQHCRLRWHLSPCSKDLAEAKNSQKCDRISKSTLAGAWSVTWTCHLSQLNKWEWHHSKLAVMRYVYPTATCSMMSCADNDASKAAIVMFQRWQALWPMTCYRYTVLTAVQNRLCCETREFLWDSQILCSLSSLHLNIVVSLQPGQQLSLAGNLQGFTRLKSLKILIDCEGLSLDNRLVIGKLTSA